MNDESFLKIEQPIKRSNSMFLHPSPDIDIKVIKQIGDYSLGTELGSGAFGKVVLGKHILTNELVAIKILDKMILSHTPDDYQSVKQEINILKSVKHKHIVQLYEVLQTSRHIFIIMEYCEGKDLLDYILTKSKLSEEESLKYFQQLINALFYLHSQNIAHRDIKIDNMLLDKNRDLKLVDFGLSTKYPDDNLLDQPCGTVVYAAPEVLQGKEYHGMLADVWSSGIVLYGMLSGYLPFGEQDDEINRKNIITGNIKFPSYFSDCVTDLLMHMLDLDPMTRYTLQEVRSHPWFNLIDYKLIPGIIIGYNIIPVDENILNLCVTYNCDKEKVRESVINNKYNSESALYYLLIKKLQKKGFHSVSDFCSDEFINFVLDDNNLIDSNDEKYTNRKKQESEIKYNININANKYCTAPHDGKLKNEEEQYENHEKNKNNKNNNLTPKNSESAKINKRINFDETPIGALSFIINTPSFEETNNNLFKLRASNSINNNKSKSTNNNNDNDSKKTNKNTSSDSKQKNITFQVVNVNDFQIGGEKNKEILDKKIINIDEFSNKLNINNFFIDEKMQTEVDNDKNYKILNIFYNNNDSNEKILIERENEQEKDIITKSINKHHINNSNILNMSNKNNIIDNSIEIIYDKSSPSNELKIRNNADLLETPFIDGKKNDITYQNTSEDLKTLEKEKDINKQNKNKNNEFVIETPHNNKENKKDINDDKCHIRQNTLSKQKNYIDRSKTYSNKNKNEEKNKLDINKINEIRKINLFQEEIIEENYFKNDTDNCIISSIRERERELKDNINISLNQYNSKKDFNSNLNYNQFTPIKKEEKSAHNSLINESNSHKSNNNIQNDNDIKILKVNLINENHDINDYKINIHSEKNYNEKNKDDNLKNENNNNENIKIINIKIDDIIKNNSINKENINDKKNNNENIKEKSNNDNIDKNENNNINKNIKNDNYNNEDIHNTENNNKENIYENINIDKIKNEKNNYENIKKDNINNVKINNEKVNYENINNENSNNNVKNNITNNCNIQQIKEEKNKFNEENIKTPIEKNGTKPKNVKIVKKKDKINKGKNVKKKNPIMKKYKDIIDINKSIEMKNKKSISKEKNNYSSKNKIGKKNEKEIVSIKVIINQNLLSKEKKKTKNVLLKNRTEQQERKIKSIYQVNVQPNTVSKSKYTTINKKPTVSIFKKKLINTCYTNQNHVKSIKIFNGNINGSHSKSSSIHVYGTMAKKDKSIKKHIVYSSNNSNSLFKINNILKNKNKQVTISKGLNTTKRLIHNKFLNKSYNNKYTQLFQTTQFKNNNLLFTNTINKTNLNKKFDEIAYKINKSTKINNNKIQDKKMPLWKYIQSDQYNNQNNSYITNNKSSSPQNDSIKPSTKNQKINKKIRDKMILHKNSRENKTNVNINYNKLNNINKKCTSLSKDKNINVFFINIKNYINKNDNGKKRANKNFIESSVSNYRYRSPYEIRELSENERNKYLNQKTRYTKIPWTIKKKALDEKKEIGELYKFYMNKNNNPFKNNNKKINKQFNNIKPINNKGNNKIFINQAYCLNNLKGMKYNNLPINHKIKKIKQYQNSILANMKNESIYNNNKKYNQSYTPQYIHKKNYFPTFKNINKRNIFSKKLCQSTNNNTAYKNNNNIFYKNYSRIFDLSCLFINEENINDCYHNLIYKLIKNSICFVQKPNKIIKCFKNGLCYEIEIEKIDEYKNDNKNKKNIYCFKIYGKNGFPINKIFRNLILE